MPSTEKLLIFYGERTRLANSVRDRFCGPDREAERMEGGAPATLGEDATSGKIMCLEPIGTSSWSIPAHLPASRELRPPFFPLREDNSAYPMPNTIGETRALPGIGASFRSALLP